MDLRLGERSLPALDSARVESLLGYLLLHRIVAHDPLREESHRLLMQLCHAADDRPRALRAYHVCATTLERESRPPLIAALQALERFSEIELDRLDHEQTALLAEGITGQPLDATALERLYGRQRPQP
jgi:DNA-binding SARP family transcriptional activator